MVYQVKSPYLLTRGTQGPTQTWSVCFQPPGPPGHLTSHEVKALKMITLSYYSVFLIDQK